MNKYEVVSVVGEGAYGVVLKCRNRVSTCMLSVFRFALVSQSGSMHTFQLSGGSTSLWFTRFGNLYFLGLCNFVRTFGVQAVSSRAFVRRVFTSFTEIHVALQSAGIWRMCCNQEIQRI
jgi:hypothetical protein